jgi:conjugative transfer signal peptidase TraF
MSWRMYGLAGCLAALSSVPGAYFGGLRIVNSESVPMGVYATEDVTTSRVARGAYACLPATSPLAPNALRSAVWSGLVPQSWKREPLLKRVVAVAGDRLTYKRGVGVLVNGEVLADSVALELDSYGNPLPHANYPVVLGQGEVWLSSEHARGFDSRYFGPVRVAALSCVGEPVWTM